MFKRIADLLSAVMLLLVISPVMIVLAVLVRVKLGGPIFFKQARTGMNMKPFYMIKFRTMTSECDENGDLLPDEKRQTPFGVWLRNTSLDELPELFNIIKGDMSVIGPRPLPVNYDAYYSEREKSRFNVRGGLITPDCIDPNPMISWEKQLEYEAEYGANLTMAKDIKVFFSVFRILFSRNKSAYGAIVRKPLNVERNNKTL
jgi:lipopolysaccharide/colanic/teichoic acid biosynthesis glycosyltransferase